MRVLRAPRQRFGFFDRFSNQAILTGETAFIVCLESNLQIVEGCDQAVAKHV
jgi:hypothetical protein